MAGKNSYLTCILLKLLILSCRELLIAFYVFPLESTSATILLSRRYGLSYKLYSKFLVKLNLRLDYLDDHSGPEKCTTFPGYNYRQNI